MSSFLVNPFLADTAPITEIIHLWNSSDKSAGITLFDSSKEAWHQSGTTEGVRGTVALSGKSCYAMQVNGGTWRSGIATAAHDLNATNLGAGTENVVWTQAGTVFFNSGTLATLTPPSLGQFSLIAYDSNAGDIWFGVFDGTTVTWNGDPAAGTGATKTDVDTGSSWYPVLGGTGTGPADVKGILMKYPGTPPSGFTPYNPTALVPDTHHWETAFWCNPASDSAGWNAFTLRQFIPAASVLKSGSKIRVKVQGGSTEGATFDAMYIGPSDTLGDDYDMDGTQQQILWAGIGGKAVGISEVATSDELTFTLDETKDMVLTAHFTDASHDIVRGGTHTGANSYNKSANEAATSNVASYTSGANTTRFFIELQTLVANYA